MGFTFHANTLAFGGQVEDAGKTKYLPSQASVALPPGGGVGESTIADFNENGVSFYSAKSNVLGNSFEDKLYNTYANVTVTKLDIEGRIQADVLSSSVTSINRREGECLGESRISFDANIIGLVIDGHPIEIDFNPEPFRRHGTYAEFVESFKSMTEEQVTELAAAYNWPLDECVTIVEGVKNFHVPRRCTTGIRASLLRSTTPKLSPGEIPGITRRGFTIEVAGFGLIHLGEVLLKAGRRRVNLMRVELGKTLDGKTWGRVSMATGGDEPRLKAVALSDTTGEPVGLTSGGSGGGYTLCSGEGNGTDFLP
ncbi:MAG TPA: hypothetical protein VJZ00_15635 [Thermoanaerobaculia bacterium]|nr:hypothetical protein [Thermoanaerobaculia bacterium]